MSPGIRITVAIALAVLVTRTIASTGTPAAHAQPAAPAPVRAVAVDERLGARIPLDAPFTDTAGRAVRLADYFDDGRPVLLLLTYNRCTMLCSLVLRGTTQALSRLDRLPGQDFRVVNVSIDPRESHHEAAREQAVVLDQLGAAGQPERWPFLVGEEPAIRALADALGFRYAWDPRTEQFAHPAVIFAIDAEGRIAGYLHGIGFTPRQIEDALDRARAGADPGAQGAGVVGAILSCFRFDAAARVFGASIESLFQGGALLILVALLALVIRSWRRERRSARAGADPAAAPGDIAEEEP